MNITLNGQSEALTAPCSLYDFLRERNLEPAKVIVEHNGNIIPQADWHTLLLKEQDCLEVLRFVGGG
jgi:sulfur carrier protein